MHNTNQRIHQESLSKEIISNFHNDFAMIIVLVGTNEHGTDIEEHVLYLKSCNVFSQSCWNPTCKYLHLETYTILEKWPLRSITLVQNFLEIQLLYRNQNQRWSYFDSWSFEEMYQEFTFQENHIQKKCCMCVWIRHKILCVSL